MSIDTALALYWVGTVALLLAALAAVILFRSWVRPAALTPEEEAQRADAERLAEKIPAPDGWTLALHWGESGGWWFRRGYTTVLCMGRLALTWIPRDLHPLLRQLTAPQVSAEPLAWMILSMNGWPVEFSVYQAPAERYRDDLNAADHPDGPFWVVPVGVVASPSVLPAMGVLFGSPAAGVGTVASLIDSPEPRERPRAEDRRFKEALRLCPGSFSPIDAARRGECPLCERTELPVYRLLDGAPGIAPHDPEGEARTERAISVVDSPEPAEESPMEPLCPGSNLHGHGPYRFFCTRCDADGYFVLGADLKTWQVPPHAPVGEPR